MSRRVKPEKTACRRCRCDPAADASRLFPPTHATATAAGEALRHTLARSPGQFGIERTRWRLEDLQTVNAWLSPLSISGIWRLLQRLDISYQRGRESIHSPDPHYDAKRAYVATLEAQALASDGKLVLLYLDELTYYRQPTVAPGYAPRGGPPRKAQRSHRANTTTRIVATLDRQDGSVQTRQASRIGVAQLVAFYQQLDDTYTEAQRLFVVQDNWPIHFHPDVLVALEPQDCPFPYYRPAHWSDAPSAKAQARWADLNLPIQLVPLPTYASWTNPIEKLWRWLKQDILHLHRWADDLDALRAAVLAFLAQFATPSADLLHYVGLDH